MMVKVVSTFLEFCFIILLVLRSFHSTRSFFIIQHQFLHFLIQWEFFLESLYFTHSFKSNSRFYFLLSLWKLCLGSLYLCIQKTFFIFVHWLVNSSIVFETVLKFPENIDYLFRFSDGLAESLKKFDPLLSALWVVSKNPLNSYLILSSTFRAVLKNPLKMFNVMQIKLKEVSSIQ